MIHYVVVAGMPDVIAPLAPRLSPAVDATAYFEGERCEDTAPGRPWIMAANTSPDLFSESRIASDGDSMVVFNGEALAASGEQASLSDALLGVFGSKGTRGVVDVLAGSYNFVGVDPAVGLRAFPDFSGLSPVYWSSSPDFVVVSNRSTTIAHVMGSAGWDLRSLAWTIGHGNLFDEHMPAAGVSYVRPGGQLEVDWGTATARVTAAPTWEWPQPGSGEGRPNLSPAEWDEVVGSLVSNFTNAQKLMGDLTLRLTGGKDSRLCLAIAKAAGMEESIHTFTTGAQDSPEVVVAKIVAKVAGFEHRPGRIFPKSGTAAGPLAPAVLAPRPAAVTNQPPPPQRPGARLDVDSEETWHRLRRDAYRYEGMINAWSALGTSPRPAVDVMGWGGELYRRGHSKRLHIVKFRSVDELAHLFINYHQPHDPLNILQPEEAEHQREWMQTWVYENAERVRLDFLPEKFYVEHRLSNWSGPLLQGAPLRTVVNPLLTALAAKKILELSPAARCTERFHYEVMRRAAPELVSIPFLNDSWDPALEASDGEIPVEQVPPAPSASAPPTASPRAVASRMARARDAGAAALRKLRSASRTSGRSTGSGPTSRTSPATPTSPATASGPASPESPAAPSKSAPPTSPPRRRPPTRNPGQLLMAHDRDAIEALFERAARDTGMGQICDMDRLIEITRRADDLKSVEVREVFGCIGVALTLLGETEPVLDRPRKVR